MRASGILCTFPLDSVSGGVDPAKERAAAAFNSMGEYESKHTTYRLRPENANPTASAFCIAKCKNTQKESSEIAVLLTETSVRPVSSLSFWTGLRIFKEAHLRHMVVSLGDTKIKGER
ncbi:hypothetical protein DL1_07170 [Thioclava dalianensis]|uniref:Uncharacterized protein n=1 Tax=Thioclava dalianensis TaxID=1185766 RepID=A0A074TIA9_9RHOB|nr:hypothetical protein DL1_07170 [Thioclava dalianensis]